MTNSRLAKLKRRSIIFSFVFLIFGFAFLVVLLVAIPLKEFCSFFNDYSIYYYIAIVAVTIGFGLLTLSFSLGNEMHQNDENNEKEKKDIEEITKDFAAISKSKEYLVTKLIISECSSLHGLDKIRSEYSIELNLYKVMNHFIAPGQDYVNLVDNVRNTVYSNMNLLVDDIDSLGGENVMKAFQISVEGTLNSLEQVALKIANLTDQACTPISVFNKIKDYYLDSLFFLHIYNLYDKYPGIKYIVDTSLGLKEGKIAFKEERQNENN